MLPCPVFSVREDGNALDGEDGIGFWGRGQFIPLFLVCYFALLMSKCNKL